MSQGKIIKVNGEEISTSCLTLNDLLEELSLSQKKIAIELNGDIVSKDNYNKTLVNANDQLEIVQFVGGG